MIAREYTDQGNPVVKVLAILDIASSTFYYRPSTSKRGRKPTTYSWHRSGCKVDDEQIIGNIKHLLNMEFVDYGYVKVTRWLKRLGLLINKKKVLRLMRSHRLMLARPKKNGSGKTWVKDLLPVTKKPFDYLEFDIKYIRVDGTGRNALLLTVVDVLSRYNMGHLLQYSIKKEDVVELFKDIFRRFAFPTQITVRSDNGSQFTSKLVREFFTDAEGGTIEHEFCRPATPEQNAHIESYHSILERAVCQRYPLRDLDEAQGTMERFREFYNFERLHSGVGYKTPYEEVKAMSAEVPKNERRTSKIQHHTNQLLHGSLS